MTDARLLLRRFMLALCIWREARGESLHGKRLVAQVIVNRMHDPRWPSSIVGVVTQRKQFSCFNPGDPNALLFPAETDRAWMDCVTAADDVLSGPETFTDANHYHTTGVAPAWADPRNIVAREGAHVFYRL